MARARSPNRDKAFEIYKEHNGNITNREIANILNEKENTISNWKCRDKWNVVLQINESSTTNKIDNKKTKKSSKKADCGDLNKSSKKSSKTNSQNPKARYNNKNAIGNIGGPGGPIGNRKAETHGFFSKYLPDETFELVEEIQEKTPLDILLEQITIQYAAIIRAQKIMFVKDKNEMIKELKKHKDTEFGEEIEYEFQFAWDRQATFLNAQSRAMGELRSSIKQAYVFINENPELVTEEQKAKIGYLKARTDKLTGDNAEIEDTSETDSDLYGDY